MEIFRALGTLVEPPVEEHRCVADLLELGSPPGASTYSEVFLFQLYPYASVYLGPEGMLGGDARDRIAGFWRVLDETPPRECDHLALMLSLYARLCELRENADDDKTEAFWSHARRAFFWEHMASWLPVFLNKLEQIADDYYGRWGRLLRQVIVAEAESLTAQETLSLHLREAPAFEDPRERGGETFLESLLVPVRSGMILVRSDLERAAGELELGRRVGERKFVLKALLAQDADATFEWLEGEAVGWEGLHRARVATFEAISDFWAERAARTAELLATLRDESLRA
ncbi:MAG: molecular chaperone TorD family protein [Acidobacteriota bacterium]|nr:molecular chaperone TorD family protein [Acidobacteriota bacterium]